MGGMTKDLSVGETFAVAVFCVALLWILGAVSNAVLRDRAFGVFGNALLMAIGGIAGIYTKILIVGPIAT